MCVVEVLVGSLISSSKVDLIGCAIIVEGRQGSIAFSFLFFDFFVVLPFLLSGKTSLSVLYLLCLLLCLLEICNKNTVRVLISSFFLLNTNGQPAQPAKASWSVLSHPRRCFSSPIVPTCPHRPHLFFFLPHLSPSHSTAPGDFRVSHLVWRKVVWSCPPRNALP